MLQAVIDSTSRGLDYNSSEIQADLTEFIGDPVTLVVIYIKFLDLFAGLVGLLHSSCCHGPSFVVVGNESVLQRSLQAYGIWVLLTRMSDPAGWL